MSAHFTEFEIAFPIENKGDFKFSRNLSEEFTV